MAKKDVSKFKEAMLSKTNMIKNSPKKKENLIKSEDIDLSKEEGREAVVSLGLSKSVDTKISKLAEKHGIDKAELINLGLKFFLQYENELFD